MKEGKKRKICLLMVGTLLCLTLIACSGNAKKTSGGRDNIFNFTGYPIQSEEKLTYWMPLDTNISSMYKNFAETPFAQELHKQTGVNVEYLHPAAGQESQALTLLVASNELPDIVEYTWYAYEGGVDKAIKDGVIVSLNDLLESDAPNYNQYIKEHPDMAKELCTDAGDNYAFQFIREDKRLRTTQGPIVRSDWMKELGLKQPETIGDMENILAQFKGKKDAKAPLTATLVNAIYIAGGNVTFARKDGKVVYSPIEDAYKESLMTLNRWYKNGLYDANFVTLDSKMINSNMLTGYSGIAYGGFGGNMGKWLSAMKETDPNYDLCSIRIVGDEYAPMLNAVLANGAAISTACKNPKIAARLLDYGYTEKGHMLYNFGTEGLSYTMQDGNPIYTDEITNNPKGLSPAQAMSKHFRAYGSNGGLIQDYRYLEQYYRLPQQKEAVAVQSKKFEEYYNRAYPATTLTAEENEKFSNIMTEVTTYQNEMATKFVIGTESFNSWDKYILQMKNYGIERAIEIKQAALDRYNRR